MTDSIDTTDDREKKLRKKLWEIIRYNKLNLSDTEAVNEIMALIKADRAKLLGVVKGEMPKPTVDDRPKWTVGSITHGHKPNYLEAFNDGHNSAVKLATAVLDNHIKIVKHGN